MVGNRVRGWMDYWIQGKREDGWTDGWLDTG